MATLNVVALYADRTLQVTRPPQTGPAGPSVWGVITGDLEDQTDLYTILDIINTQVSVKAPISSPAFTGTHLGFYGVAPVTRQTLAVGTLKTVDDVIAVLQLLGLVKQS